MSIHWGGRGPGHVSRLSTSTTGIPSIALDFLTTTSLDSRITFTRTTTATFTGSNGLIQIAAINAPRFDYDPATLAPKGLLIEEQRINLLTYSQDFTNAAYVKAAGTETVTADAGVGPDGTTTADQITTLSTNGLYRTSISVTNATSYTASVFVKRVSGSNTLQFGIGANPSTGTTVFNINTGTVTSNGASVTASSITSFGNGWYRLSVTAVTTSTTVALIYYSTAAATWLQWGAQLEAGAFATSYIPTVASQVTRTPDIANMTGTNFSSWYNEAEGSFVVSGSRFNTANFSAIASVNDGTTTNEIFVGPAGSAASAFIRSSSGAAGDMIGAAWANNTVGIAALAYQLNNAALSFNGAAVISDTTVGIPTVNRLAIGVRSGTYLNGHIRAIVYYNKRLLNTQLQTLAN